MPQEIFYQETLTQGTAVIDLPEGGHRGRCYYSGEIAHGLGEGTVRLSFAAMDSQGYEDGPLEHTQILFGDSDTLEESVYVPGIPSFKLGAVLYPDRGTFRIGVRLLENTSCRQLGIAWWASRLEPKTLPSAILPETPLKELSMTAGLDDTADENAFFITNAPRVLRVRETFQFRLAMPKSGGTPEWEVREKGGGTITQEGIYTAPCVPGIFEITARLNGQLTSVYIMVRE